MKKISLCMIVKNEEKNLDNCLGNASEYADEIIIVDTGSTDDTKKIAKKYTDKIYDFEWDYDFSKARNYSFDKANFEYIMWLDADDIILNDSIENIKKWKLENAEEDVLMCKYITSFDENLKPLFQYFRERILKNTANLRWKDPVHECITPQGKVVFRDDIMIYHNKSKKEETGRNLNIYLKMKNNNIKFSPRQQFYYARELYFNNKIDEAIHEFSKFITEDKGWVENNIDACLHLAKCYILKNQNDNALLSLFGSFRYGVPRGEVLYEIGNVFINKNDYKTAIYWFKKALESEKSIQSGAFINEDCYGFLPALQLCMCFYKISTLVRPHHMRGGAFRRTPDGMCS